MQTRKLLMALVIVTMTFVTSATAQTTGPIYDHLKCYKLAWPKGSLQVSAHAADLLDLSPLQTPIFSVEKGCVINPKPPLVCIPVDKQPRQNPVGTDIKNDFLVYKMKCLPEADIQQGFQDQFVRGKPIVKRKSTARLLLVPAYKIETPPPPCEPTAPHQCGGICPTGQTCRPGPVDICGCFDDTPVCGGNPVNGVCNGTCPNPADVCRTSAVANLCDCFPQLVDNCGPDPTAGQCAGTCAVATQKCEIILGTNICGCQ